MMTGGSDTDVRTYKPIIKRRYILSMNVIIEGNKSDIYKVSLNKNTFDIVSYDIPINSKIYERQLRHKLRQYDINNLPDKIVSIWC